MKLVWTPGRLVTDNTQGHRTSSGHTKQKWCNGGFKMTEVLCDKIRDFILENFLFTTDTSVLALDDSLLERGIVDSTGMLEIVMFIEEHFGIRMKDEEMVPENLDSVSNIAKFIEWKRQAA